MTHTLSFLNLSASQESFANSIVIPAQDDGFDDLRQEYTTMLQNQLAKGNNGLIKTKYLTFGIDADNYKSAKPRLERVETDILNNFKRLGVVAGSLNGFERLRLMHDVFHMDEQQQFRFSWDWLPQMGLSVKDFIAPSSFEFAKGNSFAMGSKVGAVSFLQILAPELNDRMLADFLDMESSLIVTMHIQSVDQVKAIKTIKRKITDLDRMKMDEQKKAVRVGYDMDIIPSDLATYGAEAKKILQDLQSRNERMFLVTFLVLNTYSTDIPGQKHQHINDHRPAGYADEDIPQLRNRRDVWQINTVLYKGGHFAAYPPKLVETCLLAGCPPDGIVLDPFLGSGTTAAVAKQLGRHYIGIELNPEYCTLAEQRIGGVAA